MKARRDMLARFMRALRGVVGSERTAEARPELPSVAAGPDRRAAAAALLGGLGALAGVGSAHAMSDRKRVKAVEGPPDRIAKQRNQWGMAIDLDRCSGCGACTIACRQENNVPVLGPDPVNQGAHIEWISMLWRESADPEGLPEVLPFPCQHCEEAPCTKVCPVGATYKDGEGITAQIWERCIGCRYCMAACPYSRRSFNWTAPEWPGTSVQLLNPDVATRSRGVVEKCTFCHHRIQEVKERAAAERREPNDEEVRYLPACASACPARAITFGDLEDPTSAVSKLSKNPRVFRLLEHLGTKPRVFYLKRDRRS